MSVVNISGYWIYFSPEKKRLNDTFSDYSKTTPRLT